MLLRRSAPFLGAAALVLSSATAVAQEEPPAEEPTAAEEAPAEEPAAVPVLRTEETALT